MNEHFIREIEIKNFKCFKDFKADGFGRVNLIGGKNNVGKTAFMEAICIDVSSKNISNMLFALLMIERSRNLLNLFNKEIDIIAILEKYKSFDIIGNNNIKYKFNYQSINKTLIITLNEIEEQINFNSKINFINNKNIIFIDNYGFNNERLKDVYEAIQLKNKEYELNQYIKNFDKNIINFKIIGGDKPKCQLLNNEYRDIIEFGDGLKHYISIICSLYACENGYLFIDEIDNGIHYTQLDKLWEIILTLSSKQQNVQIFATTHSKECIESYARVAKKLKDKEITFIELGKNKKDEIKALVMDSERFQREVKMDNEVRGW